MATDASAESQLVGKAPIGQSIGGRVSTCDCQSMMRLNKGWMDGWIAWKMLHILALESLKVLDKKNKKNVL